MSEETFKPVVSNRRTKDLYFFRGGTTFENIRTGQTGEVGEDIANKVFNFEPEISELINDHENIIELIKQFPSYFNDLKINLKF